MENMKSVKRPVILIATASSGYGHIRAAEVLKDAIERSGYDCDTSLINIFEYHCAIERFCLERIWAVASTSKVLRSIYSRIHCAVVQRNMFALRFRQMFEKDAERMIRYAIGDRNIIAYVATHPAAVIAGAAMRSRLRFHFSVVATDFVLHSLQCHPLVDTYFVPPAFRIAGQMARYVASSPKVKITGIPIGEEFHAARKMVKQTALSMLRGTKKLHVVVIFGALGLGAKRHMSAILALIQAGLPLRMSIVCGYNEALRQCFQRKIDSLGLSGCCRVFGFRKDMAGLMSGADVVIGKAGGLTISESLALGLPTAVLETLAGQEDYNLDSLLEQGVGVRVRNEQELLSWISSLLNGTELSNWRIRAFNSGIGDSTRRIVKGLHETLFSSACRA